MSEMSRLFNTTLFLDRQICTERVNAKFKMPFQRYIYFLPSGKLVLGTSDRVSSAIDGISSAFLFPPPLPLPEMSNSRYSIIGTS